MNDDDLNDRARRILDRDPDDHLRLAARLEARAGLETGTPELVTNQLLWALAKTALRTSDE